MTRLALLFALAWAVGGSPAPDDRLLVQSLVRDGRVEVAFRLEPGLSEELRAAIRSGLPATVTYDVQLRRHVFIWFDRTVASATVSASVQYDNLTRRHQLVRTVDGRGEEPQVTADEDQVRRWLTSVEHLPLFATDDLEANVEYSIRVRAQTRPRVSWGFWPWERRAATGYARFTFIR